MMAEDPLYTPFASGRYETGPGFAPLGRDRGGGPWDGKIFQFTPGAQRALAAKEAARRWPERYFVHIDSERRRIDAAAARIGAMLAGEYPDRFAHLQSPGSLDPAPGLATLWDSILSQAPEDAALLSLDPHGDRLIAVHLSAPNYWSPAEKLGLDFGAVHAPVPHMERTIAGSRALLEGAMRRGPYTRFAWGLGADDRLDRHPLPPPGESSESWARPRFDPQSARLFVRVERQTISGWSDLNLLFFTIRTYLYDVRRYSQSELRALIEALDGMPPESRRYKGLDQDLPAMLEYLRRLADAPGE